MKSLLFLGVGFLVGAAVGIQVARIEYYRLGLEEIVGVMREGLPGAELRLTALEAAEKGDNAKALRINCLTLRLKLSHFKPENFDPTQAKKVRAFLERAHSTISRLEQAGACSFGQASR